VTGTNGKTTTTYLLRAIFESHGWPAEVIGTLSGPLTTPEPIELQRRLAGMVATGTEAVAMEVSSHALVQGRVDATDFAVGVFTNLDRDHLDYHGDMDAYFEAKATLFAPDRVAVGVVNADDPWGRRLLETSRAPVVPYSTADIHPIIDPSGSTFRWRGQEIRIGLPGRFNTYNALAAATAAEALGVPTAEIAKALATADPPPGRMEIIDAGQPFRVIVDCAHTPSALQQALDTASEATTGRLIVVFGCGGDRDRTKRPQMGAIVAHNADVGILTSDNPRTESAALIFADVLAGPGGSSLVVEEDRRRAIALAVAIAAPGDTVLIAGKGDQTIQQVGPTSLPFDDRVVAREEIAAILEEGGATGCPATVASSVRPYG
jgi:UDP-N-acetylmuramoyl-L-alanyl-D-glutamate--2,6-diaminopimelate ligase